MSDQGRTAQILNDLKQAIASGLLPQDSQSRAGHLLDRIEKPLRIGLMGRPGSGKSTLRDLLVGNPVAPSDLQMPTLQLTYGDKPSATCTLADGRKTTIVNADPQQIADIAPVFVEMQMPLPALAKISILEVVAPDEAEALHRASQWAAKRCDVVLWCSRSFDADEQAIWAQMPDLIKDHAFLMMTHADQLRADDRLDAVLAQAAMVAGHDFNKILGIATIDAIAARKADGTVDKGMMRDSGGMTLIAAVLKQVEFAKQSACDAAEILLAQFPDAIVAAPQKPATPIAANVPENTPRAVSDTQAACRAALAHITAQSQQLIALVDEMEETTPARITALVVAQLQWLCDFLDQNTDATDPASERAIETAFDAADLVQLMQLERRDSAAVEAVSLLLQVKRELQAELAA